jgi:hypothetical protein
MAQKKQSQINKNFVSEHNLDFLVADYHLQLSSKEIWKLFKIGSCEGLWTMDDESYKILAISNNIPHNGHFNDVLQWFGHYAKKHGRTLKFLEVWNPKLKEHLINKRGFKEIGEFDIELTY